MYVTPEKAIKLLNSHEIVALPTETVYGLAARFDSEQALLKVFKVKQRPSFDPLIVHIYNIEQLTLLTESVTPVEHFLMTEFWPGPITFVLPKKSTISPIITSNLNSIAVRMPQNQIFRDVIFHTAPLAAPSANLFGHTSPTTAQHVESEFESSVPVLDDGPTTVGIESTVVQIYESPESTRVHIHRPGFITEKNFQEALKKYSIKNIEITFGATPASPGHIADHYQPRSPLVVIKESLLHHPQLHTAICDQLGLLTNCQKQQLNYSQKDPTHVARILYSDLHAMSDTTKSQYILMVVSDDFFTDSWRALRDRIDKACTLSITLRDGSFLVHKKLNNFQ